MEITDEMIRRAAMRAFDEAHPQSPQLPHQPPKVEKKWWRIARRALSVVQHEAADGQALTFTETLLLRLWAEVEDKTDTETQDQIADCVGWPELHGTIAGLQEKADRASPPLEPRRALG